MTQYHVPILSDEVVENLVLNPRGIYMDCTVGFGGHSEKILEKLNNQGMLIGMDIDPYAFKKSKNKLNNNYKNFYLYNCSYVNFPEILKKINFNKVDGFLFDLGISSYQVNNAHRGFSYMNDGPLDMRFNPNDIKADTAKEILSKIDISKLSESIRIFGEEKNYRRISQSIIDARDKGKLDSTFDLKNAICKTVPQIHAMKTLSRVFQAIRIVSNNEMTILKETLKKTYKYLNKGGRVAVISFHSVEDRIVKHFFKDSVIYKNSTYDIECKLEDKVFKLVNKKPIVPNLEEINLNPRSRSAKLRIAERV